MAEASDVSDLNAKRCKANENGNNENGPVKAEEDTKGSTSSDEKQGKTGAKPPEPLKDYIHVRARRGQATDSHSLAERVSSYWLDSVSPFSWFSSFMLTMRVLKFLNRSEERRSAKE